MPQSVLGRRFQQGDERAFGQVYDDHHRLVYAVGRRGTGSHEEAEEVVQQTFMQAWRAASRFDPTRPLGPWLATIARRVVIDRHRRVRFRNPVELSGLDEPATADPTDGLELVWQLRRALDLLPPAHREVLEMVHYQCLDQAQIAARLGVAVGTVKSRGHRAGQALRAILEAQASADAAMEASGGTSSGIGTRGSAS